MIDTETAVHSGFVLLIARNARAGSLVNRSVSLSRRGSPLKNLRPDMYNIPFFLCLKSRALINFLQASRSAGTRQIYPPRPVAPPLSRRRVRIFLPVFCPLPGCFSSHSALSRIYHHANFSLVSTPPFNLLSSLLRATKYFQTWINA